MNDRRPYRKREAAIEGSTALNRIGAFGRIGEIIGFLVGAILIRKERIAPQNQSIIHPVRLNELSVIEKPSRRYTRSLIDGDSRVDFDGVRQVDLGEER